jgi:pyruvate formate lyase activating enzyme
VEHGQARRVRGAGDASFVRIGGFQKFSLIDYPGRSAAVVFTQGCNFRCPYCHNPELVDPSMYGAPLDVESILGFLSRRRGLLDGVVVTGGEPTIQRDLVPFLSSIKGMGFDVKLDTNGARPDVVDEVIRRGVVDFIAMDVKAPLDHYERLSGVVVSRNAIRSSIALIQRSGIRHFFRTTRPVDLLTDEDLRRISDLLGPTAAWRIQPCRGAAPTLTPAVLLPSAAAS